jgi:hypothetical protein
MDLCPLSKWKNIFGKIREGPHSFRFLDIALVDYFLTIVLSFFITYITNIPIVITTIFSFVLGTILHILFGVNTNTVIWLGLNC